MVYTKEYTNALTLLSATFSTLSLLMGFYRVGIQSTFQLAVKKAANKKQNTISNTLNEQVAKRDHEKEQLIAERDQAIKQRDQAIKQRDKLIKQLRDKLERYVVRERENLDADRERHFNFKCSF